MFVRKKLWRVKELSIVIADKEKNQQKSDTILGFFRQIFYHVLHTKTQDGGKEDEKSYKQCSPGINSFSIRMQLHRKKEQDRVAGNVEKEHPAAVEVRTEPVFMQDADSMPKKTKGMKLERSVSPATMMNIAAAPMEAEHGFIMQQPFNRESYNSEIENGFINCVNDSLSTFSIDVDTASYANVRRFITDNSLPPAGAVRIEEMINYFSYELPEPEGSDPVKVSVEVGKSPYHQEYLLARIGVKAKNIVKDSLPSSNLVFLVDVSGSMQAVNKLPLLKESMKLLVSQLGKTDRVSIVAYAGSDRVVLPPTAADEKEKIEEAIDGLASGGATHASQGILTAYKLAEQVYMPGGNNRVILASDGDFNVGVTSRDELQQLIEDKKRSGIYLSVLGFGLGNYHDDTMEILADKGNGNYAYIDSLLEANKVLVKEMSGTLYAVADDVKIQVEFNPAAVGAYRLIGYENRMLADEDFKDDKKDAGEMGAGHKVVALYELIPAGHADVPEVDKLKYQSVKGAVTGNDELLTVNLRYKPAGKQSSQQVHSVSAGYEVEKSVSDDFTFAAAVAGFGMLLKESSYAGDFDYAACLEMIRRSKGSDPEGYRAELQRLVELARLLSLQKK